MDLHTKKIVDFSFDRTMKVELITKALQNAYHTQQSDEGLIFHSDLRSQYTSDAFQKVINKFGMTPSFSYKGSPYDNACMESFHAILKKEGVKPIRYIDEKSARMALFNILKVGTTAKGSTTALIIKPRNKWKNSLLQRELHFENFKLVMSKILI